MVRDMVLSNDDFNIHAEIVGMTEDLDDTTGRSPAIFWKFEDLDVDDHAFEIFGAGDLYWRDAHAIKVVGYGRHFHTLGDIDPLTDPVIVGNDMSSVAADAKFANHGLVSAAQDLDDFSVSPAIVLNAGDVDDNSIAMHGGLRGIARDVDVAADAFDGVIGNQESVAIAMHVEPADGIIAAELGGDEVTGADLDEFAAFGQVIEGGVNFSARYAFCGEFPDELFEGGASVGKAGDVGENGGGRHLDQLYGGASHYRR